MRSLKTVLSAVAIVIGFTAADPSYADHRFGNSGANTSGYYGGYYGPRPQPVLPTRPFFVQPYPRNDYFQRGRQYSYQNGYRDGYGDGYGDRYQGGGYRGRWCPPGEQRGYSGYRNDRGWNRSRNWGGNPQSSYYYPRSGVSFFYQSD